jgi:ribosomal protein S18 acetylase RimI-like enzyme
MRLPELKLRLANQGDLPYLYALRIATINKYLMANGLVLTKAEHMERVLDRYACSYIVTWQEQVIGLLKYELKDNRCHLIQLQIEPKYQGQGIGSYLLNYLFLVAKRERVLVSLRVLKKNPAMALYLRLGFEIKAQSEIDYYLESSVAN